MWRRAGRAAPDAAFPFITRPMCRWTPDGGTESGRDGVLGRRIAYTTQHRSALCWQRLGARQIRLSLQDRMNAQGEEGGDGGRGGVIRQQRNMVSLYGSHCPFVVMGA